MTLEKPTTWRVRPLDGPTKYTHPDVQYFNYRIDLREAREWAMEKARSGVSTFIVERWDVAKGWYTVEEYYSQRKTKKIIKTTGLQTIKETIKAGSRKLMLD